MFLRILGTSSGMAATDRHFSGYIIDCGTHRILMDTGDGIVRQLVRYEIHPESIDTILISHTHPDHAAGFISVLQWMHLNKRKNELSIFLPDMNTDRMYSILAFFQIYRDKLSYKINFENIQQGLFYQNEDLKVSGMKNAHLNKNTRYATPLGMDPECYGFLFHHKDKSLFYTSDTDSLIPYNSLSDNIDLLLTETTHITLEKIIQFADRKKIKKSVLTHIPDENEIFLKDKVTEHKNMTIAIEGELIEV